MSKEKLIKRLSWYYPTELFNVFLFSGILIYVVVSYGLMDTLFLTYGLLVMIFILYQGQHYWKLKLHRLQGKPFDVGRNLSFFRRMKSANVVLIALMPIPLLIQLYVSGWVIGSKMLFGWAIVANVFGILEHINYYHRQLMIDNDADVRYVKRYRRLKTASLKKDLDENMF